MTTRWDSFVPGQYTLAAPVVTDNALYIGSRRELRRLAITDGLVEWAAPLGALTHEFSPTVQEGVVYAAARDMIGGSILDSGSGGVVAALSMTDGTELWRSTVRVTADPTLADEDVLVPTTDEEVAHLRSLRTVDGTERWRVRLGKGTAFSSGTVAGDRAIIPIAGDEVGHVVGVAVADGDLQWDRQTESVKAPVTVADDTAYVATTGGTLHALAVNDGRERWRRRLDGGSYVRPAIDDDTVYVAVGNTIYAFATESGSSRWVAEVPNVSRTGVAVAEARVYVGGEEFTALDAATGDPVWTQKLSGVAGTFGAPTVRDGVLYTAACVKKDGPDPYDHYVYALIETGSASS